MGTFYSMPIPSRRNFDLDSVILCDGLNRLHKPKYAGSADGRFIFILGNMHVTSVQDDANQELERITSFHLDVIDLFLSKRTRIHNIGDFYNFGHPMGFYALNERNVVIVDFDRTDNTFRQRLIKIDITRRTAHCPFYRGYEAVMDSFAFAETSTGDEFAVTMNPQLLGSTYSGIVYPLNPLSTKRHKDITPLIAQANAHARQFLNAGEVGEARVSTFHPPFFITNTVLGFFIDYYNFGELIDPMKVLVMDLSSNSFYIQETKTSTSFPLSSDKLRPSYAYWRQASNREVALFCRYRRNDRCWQSAAAWLLFGLVRYTLYAAIYIRIYRWRRISGLCNKLSTFCVKASRRMLILRQALLEPKTEKYYGFGTLNTRTLEWSEIKATIGNEYETDLIPLKDGNFLVANETSKKSLNRVIGVKGNVQQKMERFRLIGNPLRMPSLTRLSSHAVQRNGRVPIEILEQIAARMIA